MSHIAPLTETERKQTFRTLLIEFGQVMGFCVLLGIGVLVLLGQNKAKTLHFSCGAEQRQLYMGTLQFVEEGHAFNGAANQDSLTSHGGTHSLRLGPWQPFGFSTDIPEMNGTEELDISVWRHRSDSNRMDGILVAEIPGHVWQGSGDIVQEEGIWERLNVKVKVPLDARNKALKVYCWNPSDQAVYFDDLEIVIHQKPSW